MSQNKSEVIYLTIIADAIREISDWSHGDLTAESFLHRLEEILEESCKKDLRGREEYEEDIRSLHASLLRCFDLLNYEHYRDHGESL